MINISKSTVLDDHPFIVSVGLPCSSVLGVATVLTTPDTWYVVISVV